MPGTVSGDSSSAKAMESIVAQAKQIADSADLATRRDLVNTLRDLATSLEEPGDAVRRLAHTGVQVAMAQVASDLDLWNIISQKKDGYTTSDLAKKVGADPVLMGRILRYMASFCMIQELSEDKYGPNNITKALTNPGLKSCVFTEYYIAGPAIRHLPGYLKDIGYANPDDPLSSPFQRAHQTQLAFFPYMIKTPPLVDNFAKWMTVQREGIPSWLEKYPFEKECGQLKLKPTDVMFVDVGGGVGHQARLLKETHPKLPGRIINEDLAGTIELAEPFEGVEHVAQDFFKPQTVKGAKYYYLRNIFHDWADERSRTILKEIIAVMAKDSKILIDELVLPNTGARWQATQSDITMLASSCGMERTERQWQDLIKSVGLKIDRFVPYAQPHREANIIVVVR